MKRIPSRKTSIPARAARSTRKRILIVDDHPLVREGLRATINNQPDLEVCGEAGSAAEAQAAVPELRPDLALIDITLPGKSGLELIKDLNAFAPNLPILAISMHEETLYAERALKAGASGYITKQQAPGELVHAIHHVLEGRIYVSERVSEGILNRFSGRGLANAKSPLEILSDRELETLQLIGDGKSLQEIARELHISPKTVAVHSANLRQKLLLKNTAQLIRFAVRWQDLRNLETR